MQNDETKEIDLDYTHTKTNELKSQESEVESANEIILESKNSRKKYKFLISENSKIKKILLKILKHIKFLDKEIEKYNKFLVKNETICDHIEILIENFRETMKSLKSERDFLEQKQLNNKISIDKLKDIVKNSKTK